MNILKIALSYINWVDIFVVICLIRILYMGYSRGFSAEIPRFLSIITIIVLTYHYYGKLGQFLSKHTLFNEEIAENVSFITLVIGLALLSKVMCFFIRMIVRISGPPTFEVIGGVIISVLRGFLLASLILTSLQFLNITYFQKSTYENSFLGAKVAKLTPMTFNYFNKIIK